METCTNLAWLPHSIKSSQLPVTTQLLKKRKNKKPRLPTWCELMLIVMKMIISLYNWHNT